MIDAGELVELGEAGGSGAPDAGGPQGGAGGGSSGCSIPGLDGYRLLFDSDGGRLERRIYSMRGDGSELTPLTPVEELAREPALSPDGTQLAYTTPEGIKLVDMATGGSELLLAAAEEPSWSPDGSRLVLRTYGSLGMLTMSDRASPMSYFSNGLNPEMTPDGAYVVYANNMYQDGALDVQSSLHVFNWEAQMGRDFVPLVSILVNHPTVSPDGIWVAAAYHCSREDRSSLWVSPLSVSTPACEGRRTTRPGSASVTNPKWGPGLLIAYERGEPPRDIAIVSAETGEECVIERPGDDRNPSWAPIVLDLPR